jgi:uncharacterized protein (DUF924 family)
MTKTMLRPPESGGPVDKAAVDPRIAAVNGFWRQAGIDKWFAKDKAFDTDFRQRFEALHSAAPARELNDWIETAEGARPHGVA